jgi:hypothetical protein
MNHDTEHATAPQARLTDDELLDLYVGSGTVGELAHEDPEHLAEGIRDMNPDEPEPLTTALRLLRIARAASAKATGDGDALLAEIITGEDWATRWAVVDTDTDMCLANNLNKYAAEQLVDTCRADGQDVYMELAR